MMPPARLLAAVDFSQSSRSAVGYATRLAHHCGAELHIVHAPNRLLCVAAEARGTSIIGEMCQELRAFVGPQPLETQRRMRFHVVPGEASRVIRDIAERESCALIVVGAHGQSANNPLPFGATTAALMRASDIPVLAVPDEWTAPSPESADLTGPGPVIVGLDLTCPSIDAASAAARLAARLRTRLVLVHVVTPVEAPLRWRPEVEAISRDHVEDATSRATPIVTTLESLVPVDMRIEIGDIATCLGDVVRTAPGALLVLGRARHSRGYGPPGAIAERVMMHAPVPILLHVPGSLTQ